MCTGVVSEEETVSAWSSLKGLWRWVGLLVEALLLVGSEVVERGPLTGVCEVSVWENRKHETALQTPAGDPRPPKHALSREGGRRVLPRAF